MTERAKLIHGVTRLEAQRPPSAAPHHRLTCGPVLLLVSDAPETADVSSAMFHHRLLCAYAMEGPVVPIRFGTIWPNAEAMETALLGLCSDLATAVEELGEAAEYCVEVWAASTPAAPEDGPADGRSYLAARRAARSARLAQAERQADLIQTLHAGAADLAHRIKPLPPLRSQSPRPLHRLAALVERARCSAFLSALEPVSQAAALANLALRITGPWPPYSFATLSPEAMEHVA